MVVGDKCDNDQNKSYYWLKEKLLITLVEEGGNPVQNKVLYQSISPPHLQPNKGTYDCSIFFFFNNRMHFG